MSNLAHKYETSNPEPQLQILPASSGLPPYMESWFALVKLNGTPRIVMVDDISDRTGFVYMKCILMGCGTVVWLEESNLLSWVFPPAPLPKPCAIKLYDYVRLVNHEKAFIVDIQGDLITVITEDERLLGLARWDVLRVLGNASVS